jgi:hypothetical protein
MQDLRDAIETMMLDEFATDFLSRYRSCAA